MPKKTWSLGQISILLQGKKAGKPTAVLTKEIRKSKNEILCYWNNYLNRHAVWSWEEVRRAVHGTETGS